MITKADLEQAIAECQAVRSPNANTAIKLASYYVLLDHMQGKSEAKEDTKQYSFSSGNIINYKGSSEFAQLINGMDQSKVLPIIDELMQTIKTLNEKLYVGVMRKIQN